MTLDRSLAREIKALNGDGTREARFETLRKVRAANKDLSTREVRNNFNDCLKKHGRAAVAICVAATLYRRRERLDGWGFLWALAVIDLWTNRTPSALDTVFIDDCGLHPTRICEYAKDFIKLMTEEV